MHVSSDCSGQSVSYCNVMIVTVLSNSMFIGKVVPLHDITFYCHFYTDTTGIHTLPIHACIEVVYIQSGIVSVHKITCIHDSIYLLH